MTRNIPLDLLVVQSLYISNIFSILKEQYFIETIESILKLFQCFNHGHTFVWILDKKWAY